MTLTGDDPNEDVLEPKNSVSVEVFIRLQNTTAHTSVPDEHRIRVQQLLDKGFALEVPEKTCAVGHSLALEVICKGSSVGEFSFRCTAKVESLKNWPEDHMDEIMIKLVQFPEDPWDKLKQIFNDRQKEIVAFLNAAGGTG
ncbi:MAG: hypothetical protein HYX41_06885 [Bdellovibrio sp.]|nr:hypothetical protein [Bdellovibrio sp.]